MSKDNRFINELVRIVNGALRLDIDKVRNYTAFLAEKLEASGDSTTADRLRKLLNESDHQLRPADVGFAGVLPVDSESRFPLVEHVKLRGLQEPPVFLEQGQWDIVNEFLSIAKSHAAIENESTGALNFLMYGPPGTGKTRLARHIARELGLELYVARLDGLISSFLGSTSKNIRALFDFAARTPCVLFLDEFDAIAKLRGDSQELGELKRVVNSFLQNLDTLGHQSIVVAATNHESLLDPAVWRRFAYRLSLTLPSLEQRILMWREFIGTAAAELTDKNLRVLADLSEGFSGSDIREACLRLKRRQHAGNSKPIALRDAFAIILNLALSGEHSRCFASRLTDQTGPAVVRVLRERNARMYSSATVAELLGTSKATANRMAHRGD